ncbi:hypothetical protein VYU27_010684, partial [Nannochloropsis oceanica]
MEANAARSLALSARLERARAQCLADEVAQTKERQEYEIKARAEEEALLAEELRVHDKVAKTMLQCYEQERLREMEMELARKRDLTLLEERRLRAAWAIEDAERLGRAKRLQARQKEAARVEGELAEQ